MPNSFITVSLKHWIRFLWSGSQRVRQVQSRTETRPNENTSKTESLKSGLGTKTTSPSPGRQYELICRVVGVVLALSNLQGKIQALLEIFHKLLKTICLALKKKKTKTHQLFPQDGTASPAVNYTVD